MTVRVVHVAARSQLLNKRHRRVAFLDIFSRLAHYHLVEHHRGGHELDVELGIFAKWHIYLLWLIANNIDAQLIELHTSDNGKSALLVGECASL